METLNRHYRRNIRAVLTVGILRRSFGPCRHHTAGLSVSDVQKPIIKICNIYCCPTDWLLLSFAYTFHGRYTDMSVENGTVCREGRLDWLGIRTARVKIHDVGNIQISSVESKVYVHKTYIFLYTVDNYYKENNSS